MRAAHTSLGFFASFILVACGGGGGGGGDHDTSTTPDGEDMVADTVVEDSTPGDVLEDPDASDTTEDVMEETVHDVEEDGELPAPRVVTCSDDPPSGADLPDPLPTYAGECPVLEPGRNTITTSGNSRTFILAVPADLDPSESLPVAFLWHWLGGDADGFIEKGEVQAAVDEVRFLAIAPDSKDDVLAKWPFLLLDSEARLEEEAVFFDDMLACVAEQFNVNESCVSTAGVSAGGLWVSQLAQLRSNRLSSFLSLSGGVGTPGDIVNPVHPWNGTSHRMPAMVLWGGPSDFCGVNFQTTSTNLEDGLIDDGHFFVECVHNCAHAEPPMEPPEGESAYISLWTFMLDHPYWLRDGESPYLAEGLPDVFPSWCGIGQGSATIREGECPAGPWGECF